MTPYRSQPIRRRPSLPTTCGWKQSNGSECQGRAGPFGRCDDHLDAEAYRVATRLDSAGVVHWYGIWLREKGRELEIPADTWCFLNWWANGPRVAGIEMPWTLDGSGLRTWWLSWCRIVGRPRLVPFDLSLFVEWWRVV